MTIALLGIWSVRRGVVAVGAFVDGVLTGRGVLRLRASAGVGEARLEA